MGTTAGNDDGDDGGGRGEDAADGLFRFPVYRPRTGRDSPEVPKWLAAEPDLASRARDAPSGGLSPEVP